MLQLVNIRSLDFFIYRFYHNYIFQVKWFSTLVSCCLQILISIMCKEQRHSLYFKKKEFKRYLLSFLLDLCVCKMNWCSYRGRMKAEKQPHEWTELDTRLHSTSKTKTSIHSLSNCFLFICFGVFFSSNDEIRCIVSCSFTVQVEKRFWDFFLLILLLKN